MAAQAERRNALVATAIVLVGIAMAATRFHFGDTPGSFLGPAAIALTALLLGDDLRNRRAYMAELEAGRIAWRPTGRPRCARPWPPNDPPSPASCTTWWPTT